MERVQYETPEDVALQFRVAGPGSRFLAYLIDQAIIAIALLAVTIVLVSAGIAITPLSRGGALLAALYYVLIGFAEIVYFTVCELRMGGCTPGKRTVGLAVVMTGGYALTAQASAIRNVFRLIDTIPLFWIVPLLTPQHRRLGDLAAGTQVVRTSAIGPPDVPLEHERYATLAEHHLELTRADIARFTTQDLDVLEELFARREAIPGTKLEAIERTLIEKLWQRLGRPPPQHVRPDAMLKELYLALREHLDAS